MDPLIIPLKLLPIHTGQVAVPLHKFHTLLSGHKDLEWARPDLPVVCVGGKSNNVANAMAPYYARRLFNHFAALAIVQPRYHLHALRKGMAKDAHFLEYYQKFSPTAPSANIGKLLEHDVRNNKVAKRYISAAHTDLTRIKEDNTDLLLRHWNPFNAQFENALPLPPGALRSPHPKNSPDIAVSPEVGEDGNEALKDSIPRFRESNPNEPIWIDDDDEDDGNDAASEMNGGEEDEDEFDIELDFGVDADAAPPEHNGVGPYTCTTLEEAAPLMAYMRSANRLVEALLEVCKMRQATMSLDVTPRYVLIDDQLATCLQHNSSTSTDGGMRKVDSFVPTFPSRER